MLRLVLLPMSVHIASKSCRKMFFYFFPGKSCYYLMLFRYGLGCKKNKVDSYIMTKASSCSLLPPVGILMPEDSEEIDGSRNVCKTRILTYRRVLFFFGGTQSVSVIWFSFLSSFAWSFFSSGSSLPLSASESWRKLVLTEFDEPCGHKVGAEIVYITDEKRFHIALLPTLVSLDQLKLLLTNIFKI